MSTKIYPKVLIFSQSFNKFSGGGITLTNLFSGWPKERIAVMTYNFMMVGVSTEICNTYYQLGKEEIHWKFPFSFIKEKPKSGLLNDTELFPKKSGRSEKYKNQKSIGFLFNLLIKLLGLNHFQSSISISELLKAWLIKYRPELLYFQISNRESINFARNLIEYLRIPSVLHMMDDWPSSIADESIFRSYWKKKIGNELQQLMNKVDLNLSICDEMSDEYKRRYGHEFHSFHNTIDIEKWMPFVRKDVSLSRGTKSILFSGRIGKGIQQSLIELAEAVDSLRSEGVDIKLNIQSPRSEPKTLDQIRRYECVTINPPVEYDRIPELYSKADILVIANDFNPGGIKFLKFSMPTKAPEFMISGTPILVYASSETAVYKLFHINKCGYCVSKQSKRQLQMLSDYFYKTLVTEKHSAKMPLPMLR